MDNYGEALKLDLREAENYYLAAFERKSEQQAYLELLIRQAGMVPATVLDLCCGAGASSHYLAPLLPQAQFTLVDFNRQAYDLAADRLDSKRMRFFEADYRNLAASSGTFDLVLCMQSLSFVEEPQQLIHKVLELIHPGGHAILSSLFNLDCDVDVYSDVVDRTRKSADSGLRYHYNTFSALTIRSWIGDKAKSEFHKFEIGIDLPQVGAGLGSHTVRLDGAGRLTISGGMLMNWAFLVISK